MIQSFLFYQLITVVLSILLSWFWSSTPVIAMLIKIVAALNIKLQLLLSSPLKIFFFFNALEFLVYFRIEIKQGTS